ncbi:MAG: glycoside hydrolase family 9 protein, partial [Pseudobutyrivibrio sp.]|nr:glycoside hydrolase family 9 protein [Pseudobutyrivibrio sp.]
MNGIFVNQVGFLPNASKKAVLNFPCENFCVLDTDNHVVLQGKPVRFGGDDISGEDVFVADFSQLTKSGKYIIEAEKNKSATFEISQNVFDKLTHDVCKCFYYLRCGHGLDKKYAGKYFHSPCHLTKATVYGEDVEPVDVSGGWHDAGDYGRYSTAGAVAVAHLLYSVRLFENFINLKIDIPEENCDKGILPSILSEVKVELDFLMKMQRKDGSVWHKVTTFNHAPFIMPEEDKEELFLFSVSSLATADIAAVFALAYTVYKNFDIAYADLLLEKSLKAYEWLENNPEPLLFKNAEGSNTGEYPEPEDYSNRFWAACALYEATDNKKYYEAALSLKDKIVKYDENATDKGYQGNAFTCFGWADVAGLGSLSLFLKDENSDLENFVIDCFGGEADRLLNNAKQNGFGLCMTKEDFIWGSNMELLKYMMVLCVADTINHKAEYENVITSGLDYLLGCNSMNVSYVTGNGENAFKNPHLRPTAV